MAPDYAQFLERVDEVFALQGAHDLLPPSGDMLVAPWAAAWDRLTLTTTPGSQTMFAIAGADGLTVSELRGRWDALVEGIASRGAMAAGAMDVVVVAVYRRSVDPATRRTVARLTPSTYIAGLRPQTIVVDLASSNVWGARPWSRSPGRELMQQALAPAPSAGGSLDMLRQAHQSRTDAFYALMRERRPFVTYALIAINVAMYGLVVATGGPNNEVTLQNAGALTYNLALQGQWWRLFTTMFLHGSPEHILFNMVSLFAVGTLAERLYGAWKYLGIYIGAGLIASATSMIWASLHNALGGTAIGASGAIFGVAGALITVRFQSSDVIPRQLLERVTSSMVPMVAISLPLSAFLSANVDSSAHVGGLIGGALLSMMVRVTQRRRESVAPGSWLHRRSS
ncbi:MAG: hypothetical protein NVS4B2_17050 [Chloroflexota bacterium]